MVKIKFLFTSFTLVFFGGKWQKCWASSEVSAVSFLYHVPSFIHYCKMFLFSFLYLLLFLLFTAALEMLLKRILTIITFYSFFSFSLKYTYFLRLKRLHNKVLHNLVLPSLWPLELISKSYFATVLFRSPCKWPLEID